MLHDAPEAGSAADWLRHARSDLAVAGDVTGEVYSRAVALARQAASWATGVVVGAHAEPEEGS